MEIKQSHTRREPASQQNFSESFGDTHYITKNEYRGFNAGFTLLIAVIFMSVMLSFGLTLGSLSYKQQVLASGAIASQYAFYVADSALECALYADQKQNLFAYNRYDGNPKNITCGGETVSVVQSPPTVSELVSIMRLPIDDSTRCADVVVYKYNERQPSGKTAFIFSTGYDISCDVVANPGNTRFVSRGMSASY